MKIFLFVAMTILIYFGKVCSLQCYVPGECNFSPVLEVVILDDVDDKLDNYNNCLIESITYNASWFSFDPNGNVCELFSSCTNLTTEYCNECLSGQLGCQPILCDTPGKCEVKNIYYVNIFYRHQDFIKIFSGYSYYSLYQTIKRQMFECMQG